MWHTAELVGAEVQQLQAAGGGCRRQSLQVHHMAQLVECKVLVAGQPCISANHHISTLLHQPVIQGTHKQQGAWLCCPAACGQPWGAVQEQPELPLSEFDSGTRPRPTSANDSRVPLSRLPVSCSTARLGSKARAPGKGPARWKRPGKGTWTQPAGNQWEHTAKPATCRKGHVCLRFQFQTMLKQCVLRDSGSSDRCSRPSSRASTDNMQAGRAQRAASDSPVN